MTDPSDFSETLRRRGERVPALLRNGLLAVAVAATGYFVVTDSGPFLAIKEFEAGLTGGKYHPVLVIACTFLLFALPVSVVVQALAGLFPEKSQS